MEGPRQAQWAPDPYRRHELRYWDGTQWTEHVSDGDGTALVDPPLPAPREAREARAAQDAAARVKRSATEQVRPASSASSSALSPGSASSTPRSSSARRVGATSAAAASAAAASAAASSSAAVPSLDLRPEPVPLIAPVMIPEPTPPAGSRAPRSASGRAPDLFQGQPGSRRAARAAGAAGAGAVAAPSADSGGRPGLNPGSGSGRPGDLLLGGVDQANQTYVTADDESYGWDWRESYLPELLSGLGVALLIGLAGLLASGGGSGSAEGVSSTVSTGAGGATSEVTVPPAKKPQSTKKVPVAQVSSAKPPRATYRPRTAAPRVVTSKRSTPPPPAPPPSPPPPPSPSPTEPGPTTTPPTTEGTPTVTATPATPKAQTS